MTPFALSMSNISSHLRRIQSAKAELSGPKYISLSVMIAFTRLSSLQGIELGSRMLVSGHNSRGSLRKLGPFCHTLSGCKSFGFALAHVAKSAGLSSGDGRDLEKH